MKPALISSYANMIPKLQAEEDMRSIMVVSAGSGSMKRSDHRAYISQLKKRAGAHDSNVTKIETFGDLESLGIPVIEESG